MLLEDFRKNSARRLKKINKMLSEQYGISISTKIAGADLEAMQKQVHENVQQLKVNGNVSNDCPELSKNLLVLEGLNELLERKRVTEQHNELVSSGPYLRVLDWLSDFVAKNIEIGDDEEDALDQAMKEYRSSKWRFPDDLIRHDCRRKAQMLLAQRQKAYTMESKSETNS